MRTLTSDVPDEAALAPLAETLVAALPRGGFVPPPAALGAARPRS